MTQLRLGLGYKALVFALTMNLESGAHFTDIWLLIKILGSHFEQIGTLVSVFGLSTTKCINQWFFSHIKFQKEWAFHCFRHIYKIAILGFFHSRFSFGGSWSKSVETRTPKSPLPYPLHLEQECTLYSPGRQGHPFLVFSFIPISVL